jgi:uncharacterized protein (TIRG00374 family)
MSKLKYLLQFLVSVLCFYALSRFVQFEVMVEAFKHAQLSAVVIVFIAMFPAVLVRAWRWYFILRRKKVIVPIGVMCRVTFIGMALNLFIPGGGGDIARSYYGWQSHGYKEAMLATSVSDKAVALFTLCLLGIMCGLAIGTYQIVWITSILTIPLGLLLFIPWRLPWNILSKLFNRIVKKDLDVDKLLATFRMDTVTMLGCVLISLIGWGITNLMYYYACLAFSRTANAWYVFATAPLINIVRAIPITISGLGSADALIIYLFADMGMAKSEALAASIIVNIFLIALPGLIGAVFILFHKNQQITKNEI